jgi:hypothetical protein
MSKTKMNFQEFADRYALQGDHYAIQGPRGQIHQAYAGWFYFQRGTGTRKFNPVTQAKEAIEAVGLRYTAPPKKDRRAFLIVKRTDGWYVADKAGPFKTRDAARTARENLRNEASETPNKK